VCRPVFLVDVEAVEDVEVFEDRVTAAGGRQDTKQLGRGTSRPVTSHRRIMSAPLASRPHNLAISAADRLLPMASPKSWRSCFSSGPVVSDGQLPAEKRRETIQRVHPQRAQRFGTRPVSATSSRRRRGRRKFRH
jgi:hypothetical protein